jgi:hypothetical protein
MDDQLEMNFSAAACTRRTASRRRQSDPKTAERLGRVRQRYGKKRRALPANVVDLEAHRRELAARARTQRLRELRFRARAEGSRGGDRDQAS